MGICVPLIVVAAIAPASADAEADEARVVIQTRAAVDGLDASDILRRSSQELRARGFVVEAVPAGTGELQAELRAAAEPRNAALGVGIVMLSRAAVELTVIDRVTGKHLTRALDLSDSDNVASMVALATGELVEASLIELRLEHETVALAVPVPAALPVPPVEPGTSVESDASARWSADAGVGALWPVRAGTAGLGLELAFTGHPIPRLGLGLWAGATAVALTGRYEGSTTRARPIAFGGSLRVNAILRKRVIVPVEVRGGAGVLAVDADSTETVEGRSFRRWMGHLSLGSGVLGRFGPGHAGIRIGVVWPVGAPRLTAVPDPAVPDEQLVLVDLRGPWVTATAVVGLHW